MHILTPLLSLIPILPLTTALPSPSSSTPALKPYQLRGVASPIFHLYLQPLPSNKSVPVMGPEASSEYYNLGATIQSTNTSMYLNIGTSPDGKSYLPLSFGAQSTGSPWALEGDTIITATDSVYKRREFCGLLFPPSKNRFVTCAGVS